MLTLARICAIISSLSHRMHPGGQGKWLATGYNPDNYGSFSRFYYLTYPTLAIMNGWCHLVQYFICLCYKWPSYLLRITRPSGTLPTMIVGIYGCSDMTSIHLYERQTVKLHLINVLWLSYHICHLMPWVQQGSHKEPNLCPLHERLV